MVFTEEGRQMAAEQGGETKAKRGRPAKAAVVESEQQVVDPVLAEIEAAVAAEQAAEEVPFPTAESAFEQGLT
jgi:hypothetical protein